LNRIFSLTVKVQPALMAAKQVVVVDAIKGFEKSY
jgi:hypothetical protein